MADKSPRNSETKKAGKSIKEKRAEKRAGTSGATSVVPEVQARGPRPDHALVL
jgi:hypothetical protein